jgi:plastocyanin
MRFIVLFMLLFPPLTMAEHSHDAHPLSAIEVIDNPPQDEDGRVIISIVGFQYIPAYFKVKTGTVVRWVNQEKRQFHNVWFEEAGDPEPPYFFPGEFYERQFDTPGIFPYHCSPHPQMIGQVIVEEASTGADVFTWEHAQTLCARSNQILPDIETLKELLRTDHSGLSFWSATEGMDNRSHPDLVRMLHEYGVGSGFEEKHAWYANAHTHSSASKRDHYAVRCVEKDSALSQ